MSIKRETVEERKALPLASGVLDYFPDALLAVAEVSRVGNEQHHPGEPLHWDKSKSTDEADALLRHLLDRGTRDTDGMRHSAKVAWRALALLQRELDREAELAENEKLIRAKAFPSDGERRAQCSVTGNHEPGKHLLDCPDSRPVFKVKSGPLDVPPPTLTLENRGELGTVFRYYGYCLDCGSSEHTLDCPKYED